MACHAKLSGFNARNKHIDTFLNTSRYNRTDEVRIMMIKQPVNLNMKTTWFGANEIAKKLGVNVPSLETLHNLNTQGKLKGTVWAGRILLCTSLGSTIRESENYVDSVSGLMILDTDLKKIHESSPSGIYNKINLGILIEPNIDKLLEVEKYMAVMPVMPLNAIVTYDVINQGKGNDPNNFGGKLDETSLLPTNVSNEEWNALPADRKGKIAAYEGIWAISYDAEQNAIRAETPKGFNLPSVVLDGISLELLYENGAKLVNDLSNNLKTVPEGILRALLEIAGNSAGN